jgi:hypothetical protein
LKPKFEVRLILLIMSFTDYSFSSGAPDSEKEAMKAMRIKKKSFLEKENEMAMAMLLGSSTDEDDDGKE